jgi:hypothetical protein
MAAGGLVERDRELSVLRDPESAARQGAGQIIVIEGTLDPGFAGDGILTADFHGAGDLGQDVALDNAGRIVAAGYTANGPDTEFALMRASPWSCRLLPEEEAGIVGGSELESGPSDDAFGRLRS